MKRSGWMAGAKAVAATTALACVGMAMATTARADTYNFTFANADTNFSGAFQATLSGIGSNLSISGGSVPISYVSSGAFAAGSPANFGGGSLSLNNGFANFNAQFNQQPSDRPVFISQAGSTTGSSATFYFGNVMAGIFTAFDTSSPGGGGGGGGGGNSGGAPSPEVNTFLGLALAGGTVAILRRRRGKPLTA